MEQRIEDPSKDGLFPKLSTSSDREGPTTYEHLLERLNLRKANSDIDIRLIRRNLDVRRANKEALETLRQKILTDNLQREKLNNKNEKVPIIRRKLFKSEILRQKLAESQDKKTAFTWREDVKNSMSKNHFFTATTASSMKYSVTPSMRTRQDTHPLPQFVAKRDSHGVTMTQDVVTGTVIPLQCRPNIKSKGDGSQSPLSNYSTPLDGSMVEKVGDDFKNIHQNELNGHGSWFPSSVFPLLPKQTNHKNRENVSVENTEHDSTLKRTVSWEEESEQLSNKIKQFVAKPNPTRPPPSLKIRRSTIHNAHGNTHGQRYSKINKDPVQGLERSKVYGVVNFHTCPNINIFKDRSWMYQDRLGKKCRYIREKPSPVPPIEHVFRHDKTA